MADPTQLDGDLGGSGPNPTELDGHRPRGVQPTELEGSVRPAYVRRNLPDPLAARYSVIRSLGEGAQADVLLCQSTADDSLVAIKLYRLRDGKVDLQAMTAIQSADPAHVVPTEMDQWGDEIWEIQEFFESGTLGDMTFPTQGWKKSQFAKDVVLELASAVAYIHSLNLVHRDIKPSNVLVRSLKPLDLVLGDFGLTRELLLSREVGSISRTPGYASPEALNGTQSFAGDWWSVGVTLFEILVGRHLFSDEQGRMLPEGRIYAQLIEGEVDLDEVSDDRWKLLLRGLLTKNPTHRWNFDQVQKWLNGDSPAIHFEQASDRQPRGWAFAGFGSQTYQSPPELGAAMAADWPAAASFLGGRGADALRNALAKSSLANESEPIFANYSRRTLTIDGLLFELIQVLAPDQTMTFRGRNLTPESLAEVAQSASKGSEESADWIKAMRTNHILEGTSGHPDYQAFTEIDRQLHEWWAEHDRLVNSVVTAQDAETRNNNSSAVQTAPVDIRAAIKASSPTFEGELLKSALNPDYASHIRANANKPAGGSRRAKWYSSLDGGRGHQDTPNPAQDLLRIALLPAAKSEAKNVRSARASGAAAQRARIAKDSIWGRTWLGAIYVAGAFVALLIVHSENNGSSSSLNGDAVIEVLKWAAIGSASAVFIAWATDRLIGRPHEIAVAILPPIGFVIGWNIYLNSGLEATQLISAPLGLAIGYLAAAGVTHWAEVWWRSTKFSTALKGKQLLWYRRFGFTAWAIGGLGAVELLRSFLERSDFAQLQSMYEGLYRDAPELVINVCGAMGAFSRFGPFSVPAGLLVMSGIFLVHRFWDRKQGSSSPTKADGILRILLIVFTVYAVWYQWAVFVPIAAMVAMVAAMIAFALMILGNM